MPINGGSSFRKCVWSMEKKKLSLPKQIGIALLLGILAGYAFYMLGIPEFTTNYLKPFGTIFVNLLKFIVVPVVLLSMIDGIISMGDMKKVGSVGWKTVAYFLVTTAAACVIGLVFANLFNNAGWFPTLALEDGAVHTSDEISEGSGLPSHTVLAALTQLEIFGLVRVHPGRRFSL